MGHQLAKTALHLSKRIVLLLVNVDHLKLQQLTLLKLVVEDKVGLPARVVVVLDFLSPLKFLPCVLFFHPEYADWVAL